MMWFQFEDCKPEEKRKKPSMVQNPQVFPCQYQKSEGSELEKKALEEIYASQAKLRKGKDEARRFNKCQMHCL